MSAARDRVVDAALTMFAAHGYDGVSMRDLGRELGMRAPSIYSHFPSKLDLLTACLKPLMDRVDELLRQPPEVPATSEDVRSWLEQLIRAFAEQPAAATILMTDPALRSETPLKARLDEATYRLFAMFEVFGISDRLSAAATLGALFLPVARGAATPADAPRLSASLMALFGGLTRPSAARATPVRR